MGKCCWNIIRYHAFVLLNGKPSEVFKEARHHQNNAFGRLLWCQHIRQPYTGGRRLTYGLLKEEMRLETDSRSIKEGMDIRYIVREGEHLAPHWKAALKAFKSKGPEPSSLSKSKGSREKSAQTTAEHRSRSPGSHSGLFTGRGISTMS